MATPTPITTSNKLQGKVAIVTGGASGIGEATARRLADYGARAVVIADVQDDKAQAVVSSIGSDRCTFIHCDVSDEEQVRSRIETTVCTHGRLDIMFSNAGVVSKSEQTVLDLDLYALEHLFAVNVRGMSACVKHAARAMVEGGIRGSIICTASCLASRGTEKLTDYIMSKSAVVSLMKSASLQLGGHGIRVNSVSPGMITTAMTFEFFKMGWEEAVKLAETTVCLKKGGKRLAAEDVAEAVAFLGSDESEFVTGHDLVVDGGYVQPPW
ncbi:hypothetical protein UlMin_008163 [Ulmus minor]